jgi:hypothetical protein
MLPLNGHNGSKSGWWTRSCSTNGRSAGFYRLRKRSLRDESASGDSGLSHPHRLEPPRPTQCTSSKLSLLSRTPQRHRRSKFVVREKTCDWRAIYRRMVAMVSYSSMILNENLNPSPMQRSPSRNLMSKVLSQGFAINVHLRKHHS